MPKQFRHPTLGLLIRVACVWEGSTTFSGREISISIRRGWRSPDESQIQLLVSVLPGLPDYDQVARSFASSDFDPEQMQLIGVHVLRPASAWRIAKGLADDSPLVFLQYMLPNDLNVVDVTFVGESPIEVDYH